MGPFLCVGLRSKNKDITAKVDEDDDDIFVEDMSDAMDIKLLYYGSSVSRDLAQNTYLTYGSWTVLDLEKLTDIQNFYRERISINEKTLEQYKTRYIETEALLLHADTDIAYQNLSQDLYDIREMQFEIQEELVSYYYRAAEWNVMEDAMKDNAEEYDMVYYYG